MELRPYQQAAREAILENWAGGVKKTLLVLPTGTGKTIVFAKIIEDRVKAGDRVLVLAHRGELLEQAADKLFKTTGIRCAVEKAEQTSLDSWFRVTVGSVQTLSREKRLQKFPPDYFGTIIVDEAHHAVSESYQRVLKHFEEAKVLGVTATPDRGDKKALGAYFETLAYEYKLDQAVRDGYLCEIRNQTIPLKIDLSGVAIQAGDFSASDVGHALDPYLEQIADEMLTYCQGRKTVVFLPLITTAQKFTRMLQRRGFKAQEINGESEGRAAILQDFDAGRYDVLCNAMLLTEGWDCPSVDCIIVLRPTKIRSLYAQMVGRGTRLCPGKEGLLLLDFLWLVERHNLCTPASLIAKSKEVEARMASLAEDGAMYDLFDLEEQAERDVMSERENALAKELQALRTRKKRLVDPLQYAVSICAEDLEGYAPAFGWEMLPASEKQLHVLEKFGISGEGVTCAGYASMIIDRLIERKGRGLSTPKQIRFLESRGFIQVGTWRFDDARKLIDRIAGNGWLVPHEIQPESYRP